MDEQMQQLIVQLVKAAMQGDQQAQQQVQQIMQAAQQGDQQAAQIAQMIQAVVQQMQGGAPSMRQGGAVTYLKYLKGECPEGYEMQYFKKGGAVCKQCMKKKMAQGAEMNDPISAFKCGRKMKKAACGTKMKKKLLKKQEGGTTPTFENKSSVDYGGIINGISNIASSFLKKGQNGVKMLTPAENEEINRNIAYYSRPINKNI